MDHLHRLQKLCDRYKTTRMKLSDKNYKLSFLKKQLVICQDQDLVTKYTDDLLKMNQMISLLLEERLILKILINDIRRQINKENNDTVELVVSHLTYVYDKNYLIRCIKFLRGPQSYCVDNNVPSVFQLLELDEGNIIEKAHQIYNKYLIVSTGPHEFFHHHDNHNLCYWDGYSDKCNCDSECVKWYTNGIDWLQDINLDASNPIGHVDCSW
uniref:Uncharacterized protein n=1 Tax=Moumouvirus sp. 'Monve' TaxID=1128131 RepID=H2EEJ7_9VIRU|nr:hypothetical protein mv_L615 [Moumouvirus Monve]